MRIENRLRTLEQAHGKPPVLIVVPDADGTYTGEDQHHKGQVFTEAQVKRYGGPVIVWDV